MFQPVQVIETGQYGICEVNEKGAPAPPILLRADPQEAIRACQNAARAFTTRGIAKYSAEAEMFVPATKVAPPPAKPAAPPPPPPPPPLPVAPIDEAETTTEPPALPDPDTTTASPVEEDEVTPLVADDGSLVEDDIPEEEEDKP